jgi:hypothetical protein
MKALAMTGARGRLLFCGATCRGSTADITWARRAGLVDRLAHTAGVEVLTDADLGRLAHATELVSIGSQCSDRRAFTAFGVVYPLRTGGYGRWEPTGRIQCATTVLDCAEPHRTAPT